MAPFILSTSCNVYAVLGVCLVFFSLMSNSQSLSRAANVQTCAANQCPSGVCSGEGACCNDGENPTLCGGECCYLGRDGDNKCFGDAAEGVCCSIAYNANPTNCGGQCCYRSCIGNATVGTCCPEGYSLCGGDCCGPQPGGETSCNGDAVTGQCLSTTIKGGLLCGGNECFRDSGGPVPYTVCIGDALAGVCCYDSDATEVCGDGRCCGYPYDEETSTACAADVAQTNQPSACCGGGEVNCNGYCCDTADGYTCDTVLGNCCGSEEVSCGLGQCCDESSLCLETKPGDASSGTCCYSPPGNGAPPVICGGNCCYPGFGDTCYGDATTGVCCPQGAVPLGGMCCNDGATLCGSGCCNVQTGYEVCHEASGVCCFKDDVPCGNDCCSPGYSTCQGDPSSPSAKCCQEGSVLCGGSCCDETRYQQCIGNATLGACCYKPATTEDTPYTLCGGQCCHTGQYDNRGGPTSVCFGDEVEGVCCDESINPEVCGGRCCNGGHCIGNATVGNCCRYDLTICGGECCDLNGNGYYCLQAGTPKETCCYGDQSTVCGSQCCDAAQGFNCLVDGATELCCYGDGATICGGLCCTGACMGDAQDGTCCYGASNQFCLSGSGHGDPHYRLEGFPDGKVLEWDFHGRNNKCYCMVSDTRLALTVHMFSLAPDARILERPEDDGLNLFEGTWMDGLGILYIDDRGEQKSIAIVLNTDLDRAGEAPFEVTFEGDDVTAAVNGPDNQWTSPDGTSRIRRSADRANALSVSVAGLLEMEVVSDVEKELIADPPVHFLNFDIKAIANTANVHGFLGQMFAPGAVDERLAMGTLEGLRHREYVEGTDDDYLTSGLTSADCGFSRFGEVPENLVVDPLVASSRRLFSTADYELPVTKSAVCRLVGKGRNAFMCA
ncbi:hypothetical protein KFL_001820080 [Klebsormidium nitens]|uniref:Uncharacterized protein n=1 Tax=Klebsormidium nitens TaxID=105231 RepID=A0A1Y1I017_KLENI|nr:hypothetical protein KFL_001820080 [Klebsormidium nitens]|eukprot:GAQ84255.1 hypothetical protein KFL_001820080 [Klebsormidium nitens]